MFGRPQRPEPDAIEVIIGPRAIFSGQLQCDASIRIDGAVDDGQIETPANVVITDMAQVRCNITAKTVSIRGIFRGIIHAERVELLRGSQIYGSLNVHSFFMDEGVLMQAELNIENPDSAKMQPNAQTRRLTASTNALNGPTAPSSAPSSAPLTGNSSTARSRFTSPSSTSPSSTSPTSPSSTSPSSPLR